MSDCNHVDLHRRRLRQLHHPHRRTCVHASAAEDPVQQVGCAIGHFALLIEIIGTAQIHRDVRDGLDLVQRAQRLLEQAQAAQGTDTGGTLRLGKGQAFADFAEECYGMGYRAFKMHGWTDGGTENDINAILGLGKRVGGKMALMHDSACHLKTFGDAVIVGKACDEAGFFWYEVP